MKDEPAFPTSTTLLSVNGASTTTKIAGLTKREYFSLHLLQNRRQWISDDISLELCCTEAIILADTLIKMLEKYKDD